MEDEGYWFITYSCQLLVVFKIKEYIMTNIKEDDFVRVYFEHSPVISYA